MCDIVIADDDEAVLSLLAKRLSTAGHNVRTAKDGREALALVRQRAPDLAVIDIIMPRCDGIETLIELRKAFPQVKVLAISGSFSGSRLNYLGMAQRLGAHDILEKPFSGRKLLDTIAMLRHNDRTGPVRLLDH